MKLVKSKVTKVKASSKRMNWKNPENHKRLIKVLAASSVKCADYEALTAIKQAAYRTSIAEKMQGNCSANSIYHQLAHITCMLYGGTFEKPKRISSSQYDTGLQLCAFAYQADWITCEHYVKMKKQYNLCLNA